MKYRKDFVTNSSSSSYIISLPKDFKITTTDKKLEYFVGVISKEFHYLFNLLNRVDDEYNVIFYKTLEDIADNFLEQINSEENRKTYFKLIYKNNKFNEEGFKKAIKLEEHIEEYRNYGVWIGEIKKGNVICKMSSSNHNSFICALMYLIKDSDGVVFLEDTSC